MFPLVEGNKWNYSYRAGFKEGVEPIEVGRTISVAGVKGFELDGPMGISHVAWKDRELVTTALPNLGLMPPLPLLVGGQKEAQRKWEGWLIKAGEKVPAKATLVQESETKTIGSRKYETVKCTVTVITPNRDKPIELLTWYAEGIGPVRQEQRIGGELLIALEYLSGP
jgi:hypothetical protein